MVNKSLLDGVKLSIFCQSFDSQNIFPLYLVSKNEAAFNCLAID